MCTTPRACSPARWRVPHAAQPVQRAFHPGQAVCCPCSSLLRVSSAAHTLALDLHIRAVPKHLGVGGIGAATEVGVAQVGACGWGAGRGGGVQVSARA